jgi:hypothetical protein
LAVRVAPINTAAKFRGGDRICPASPFCASLRHLRHRLCRDATLWIRRRWVHGNGEFNSFSASCQRQALDMATYASGPEAWSTLRWSIQIYDAASSELCTSPKQHSCHAALSELPTQVCLVWSGKALFIPRIIHFFCYFEEYFFRSTSFEQMSRATSRRDQMMRWKRQNHDSGDETKSWIES